MGLLYLILFVVAAILPMLIFHVLVKNAILGAIRELQKENQITIEKAVSNAIRKMNKELGE